MAVIIVLLVRYFYWIDETNQVIKRSYLPNTKTALGRTQTLTALQTSVGNDNWLDALSIDWIGKNLYYSDGKYGTISVAKADGRYSRTIIKENAEHVCSLVVNPMLGYKLILNYSVKAQDFG